MKYKYTAIIKPVYKLDVTDWNDENESKSKMVNRLKNELADISVFSLHCDYETLKDIEVEIIKEKLKN